MNKTTHGGARVGSGAHKKESKRQSLTVRLPPELIEKIPGTKTRFVEAAIVFALDDIMKTYTVHYKYKENTNAANNAWQHNYKFIKADTEALAKKQFMEEWTANSQVEIKSISI